MFNNAAAKVLAVSMPLPWGYHPSIHPVRRHLAMLMQTTLFLRHALSNQAMQLQVGIRCSE
jgi:hypothetical protein